MSVHVHVHVYTVVHSRLEGAWPLTSAGLRLGVGGASMFCSGEMSSSASSMTSDTSSCSSTPWLCRDTARFSRIPTRGRENDGNIREYMCSIGVGWSVREGGETVVVSV